MNQMAISWRLLSRAKKELSRQLKIQHSGCEILGGFGGCKHQRNCDKTSCKRLAKILADIERALGVNQNRKWRDTTAWKP